ncbi:MAG: CTP synthase [Anaerolineae bacterium]
MAKPKYIFCTGGVVSSVGKGVTAAAIGRILKARGLKVAIQKLDPYLNVDPGTMSPYQHGEVFVTADGAETDLDLGHYERFIDENLDRTCNVTAGQVYGHVIDKERRGDYLGGTIQVIPHITNEIKRRIALVGKQSDADVVIIEVGGTVGDIEGQPFLEAIRQMRMSLKRRDTLYVHVTFLPYIGATGELKTKPTQHSVRDLRGAGIQPNVIIARTDHPVDKDVVEKLSLFCDVDEDAVIPLVTTDLLYEVPLLLEDSGLGDYLVDKLKLEAQKPDLSEWRKMVQQLRATQGTVRIAIVGKYVELHDAYMSVKEAAFHAAGALGKNLEIKWVHSGDLEKGKGFDELGQVDGIIVPGGFGYRGVEGKVLAARLARERNIPYLGLCLGMQVMSIEFARNVLQLEDANSSEFEVSGGHHVIDLMQDQRGITDLGGTMRLGWYPCHLTPDTNAARSYGEQTVVQERHRHRFEFNNAYRAAFEANGAVFSGLSPDEQLVEIMELRDHPFMLGSQFHPEFQSRPNSPHPLFLGFIQAALDYGRQRGGMNGLTQPIPVADNTHSSTES